jgi:uncharacterized protein YbaA (DUF1428 family)
MAYVDGFVVPVPKKNLNAYRALSKKASRVFKDHGAIEYRECAGDDLDVKGVVTFPRTIKLKPGETVVFAWVMYTSRAHRDRANAKIMKDPRLLSMMSKKSPFDCSRMVYGGFKVIVDA